MKLMYAENLAIADITCKRSVKSCAKLLCLLFSMSSYPCRMVFLVQECHSTWRRTTTRSGFDDSVHVLSSQFVVLP